MPQQNTQTVEANFSGGFKTEFTGLNFPENSCTDASNVQFSRLGNVSRRQGIEYEVNRTLTEIDRTNKAVNTYKWNNASGDGLTEFCVVQIGGTLYFFRSSTATVVDPLSDQRIGSTVTLSDFLPTASTQTINDVECQFADGNGYLFVFHPHLDPFYCTYDGSVVTAKVISVRIRDFTGAVEPGTPPDNLRPTTLTAEHNYNLINQGWTNAPTWVTTSASNVVAGTGAKSFQVDAGLTTTLGQTVLIASRSQIGRAAPDGQIMIGNLTAYAGTTMDINVTVVTAFVDHGTPIAGSTFNDWNLHPISNVSLGTWNTALSNYPSNADVWWRFKNSSGVFDPATTAGDVILSSSPAPRGSVILEAFNQQRTLTTGISGITSVATFNRPRTGTWFQGRAWYAGVDGTVQPSGSAPLTTWSENIYFSQVIQNIKQVGFAYQVNDPTSDELFDLLPTDGGVITIQGCGSIYKLFPFQNGLLVFAANGIWYITGNQGIGFSATDYNVIPLSSVQSISGSSFVNVQGIPIWWNEEGIYMLSQGGDGASFGAGRGAATTGGFAVQSMTLPSIQTFYQDIPLLSKKYVKGTYDPLNYQIQWIYRSTDIGTVTNRYEYDRLLCFNTDSKAFSPWTIGFVDGAPNVNGIIYIQYPGGTDAPDPTIKYLTSRPYSATYQVTFSEENSDTYRDWNAERPVNYLSYFVSGYKLMGAAQRKFQSNYVHLYVNNYVNMSYKLQGIWDYALHRDSNKFTSLERVDMVDLPAHFSVLKRKHKVRGKGLALQFKITSVDGAPFDIIGWSVNEKVNASV